MILRSLSLISDFAACWKALCGFHLFYFLLIDSLLVEKKLSSNLGGEIFNVGFELEALNVGNIVNGQFISLEDEPLISAILPCFANRP